MMPIRFYDADPIDDEGPIQIGVIQFGELHEDFESSLHRWSKEDYEASWKDAATSVLRGENAAFITEFSLPEDNNRLRWWPLYVDGNLVHMQEHLLWFDQLEKPFDTTNPFASLELRITHSDDGSAVSEWTVGLEEFRSMLAKETTSCITPSGI